MRVDRMVDAYAVTVTTRGLPEGSRWRGLFGISSGEGPIKFEDAELREVARDGGWTVTATFAKLRVPYFSVTAFGPGPIRIDSPHLCNVLSQPAQPLAGVTWCRKAISISMVAMHRRDIGLVVRWGVFGTGRGTAWTTRVRAVKDGVTTDATAWRHQTNRSQWIQGRTVFADAVDPRLILHTIADGGQRCTLSIRRVFGPALEPPAPAHVTSPTPVLSGPTFDTVRDLLLQQRELLTTVAGR